MYGSSSTSEKSEKMNEEMEKSDIAEWVISRHSYSCWSTHSLRCLNTMVYFSRLMPSRSFSASGLLSSRFLSPR